MALLFSLKYYKNTKICHDIVQLFSYQSQPFQLEFSRSCLMCWPIILNRCCQRREDGILPFTPPFVTRYHGSNL
jgi:hypothetical protein